MASWKELKQKQKTMLAQGFDNCDTCGSYKPIMKESGLCFKCEMENLEISPKGFL